MPEKTKRNKKRKRKKEKEIKYKYLTMKTLLVCFGFAFQFSIYGNALLIYYLIQLRKQIFPLYNCKNKYFFRKRNRLYVLVLQIPTRKIAYLSQNLPPLVHLLHITVGENLLEGISKIPCLLSYIGPIHMIENWMNVPQPQVFLAGKNLGKLVQTPS